MVHVGGIVLRDVESDSKEPMVDQILHLDVRELQSIELKRKLLEKRLDQIQFLQGTERQNHLLQEWLKIRKEMWKMKVLYQKQMEVMMRILQRISRESVQENHIERCLKNSQKRILGSRMERFLVICLENFLESRLEVSLETDIMSIESSREFLIEVSLTCIQIEILM